ncbi:hypothetical protein [Candidatus Poriferisocius sp.]|uniref:hypothetical protein n=1 Tax=Candidatus Poriferisocius sp. TaxID=3101276 RepID=UPI003B0157C8
MSNPAAALGQEVGKLFEASIVDRLRPDVEVRGHTIGPQRMKNGTDNVYQIDAVISNANGQPVMILDPKYIRYKKHNRDKGSWLCVAHYNLRKTYPTIRKTTAVLAGNWSRTSLALIESFGIEVITAGFQGMVDVLGDFGVEFDWDEKDRSTPTRALEAFNRIGEDGMANLAFALTDSIMDKVTSSVLDVLDTDAASVQSRVSAVEVLVKTDRHEMLLMQFDTVAETVSGLVDFMDERSDVSDLLERGQ